MVPETVSHYRVIRKLGGGGMGVVYEAVDHQLGRRVAIKFLSSDIAAHPHAVTRLRREARAVSALNHPNICTVYEFGEYDGHPFIVFELLTGATLSATLAGRPLPLEVILEYGAGIAAALDCAHRVGIIHRDVKPGNLFVTGNHQVKVLDFGLAKPETAPRVEDLSGTEATAASTMEPITEEGMAVGTAAYMSPEQALGDALDHRSDIFSLGAVLHEMATGQRAFDGATHVAIHQAVLHRTPPPPSRLNAAIPAAFDEIVAKALEKDRDLRYQSAAEVRVDLQRLLRGVRSGPTTPLEAPAAARPRTSRPWLVGAGVAGLVLTAAAAWLYFGSDPPSVDPFTFANRRPITSSSGAWESEPSLSHDGNFVAYTSNQGGNQDVWVMSVSGGTAVNVTAHPAQDREPVWLPDASGILFTSDRDGRPAIWKVPFPPAPDRAQRFISDAADAAISASGRLIGFVRAGPSTAFTRIHYAAVDALGSVRTLTTSDDGRWGHHQPAWSPDERWIAYRAQNSLWKKAIGAERGVPLVTGDAAHYQRPVWSPDGRWIYFSSDRGGSYALWRVRSAGGAPELVTPGVRLPTLSGDGTRLVCADLPDNRNLVLRDVVRQTDQVWGGTLRDWMPALSPDGRTAVFVSDRAGGSEQLWGISVADLGSAVSAARPLTTFKEPVSHPSMSPDGRHVVFYRIFSGSRQQRERRELWVADVAGGQPRPLTADHSDIHPAWSPPGTPGRIAFARESDALHIWVVPVRADGSADGPPWRLTSGPAADMAPAWSPDGKWIAYLAEPRYMEGDIRIVAADGRSPATAITSGIGAQRVQWFGQDGRSLMVVALWGGSRLEARVIDREGRPVSSAPHAVDLGENLELPDFELSRDGRWMIFARDERQGDLLLLDTRFPRR